MNSIEARLRLGLGTGLMLVLLALGLASGQGLRLLIEAQVEERLGHDAEALLAALQVGPGGDLRLDSARTGPVYVQVLSGHYFRIDDGRRVIRSRSLWDEDLDVPRLAAGERRLLDRPGPAGQRLRVLVQGFDKGGVTVTLAVAEDMTPVIRAVHRLQWLYGVAAVGALLLMLLWLRWQLRRGLAPLEATRHALAQWQAGARPRLEPDAPAEVRPLVEEFNRLLDTVEARLAASREALGNLAHALKTPLARMRQMLDHPERLQDPAVREELDGTIDRIDALMQRELRRARIAGGSPGGATVALRPVVEALFGVMAAVHRARGLAFEDAVPTGLRWPMDAEDLTEVLGNLLDNACKWARGRVRVSAGSADGRRWLAVEDDGPGVPPEARERLVARGRRLDEAVPGHGLGLAIVRDILARYPAVLGLDASPDLGGLRVRVDLTPPKG